MPLPTLDAPLDEIERATLEIMIQDAQANRGPVSLSRSLYVREIVALRRQVTELREIAGYAPEAGVRHA